MNFPMDYPFFQFVYWLLNTPGLGGIAVSLLAGAILLTFAKTLLWISQGGQAEEREVYSYPTVGLHEHDE